MSKTEELYEAIRNGRLEAVENFLSQPGINTNRKFEGGGETMISAAVRRGSVGIVDLLLKNGANVNMQISDKAPLQMASYDGDIRLVKALLGHGADIESKDETDRTAIHWAARQGHYGVFKYLEQHQASLREVAADGNTLLHDAAMGGDPDIIEHITDKLMGVQARNNDGDSPLHLASAAGHSLAMHKLLQKGATVEDRNSNSENILHIASRIGHLRVIKLLVENLGADKGYINQATKDACFTRINEKKCVTKYWTSLHFACAFGHFNIVKYLLSQGADKNIRTQDKLNAIEVCKAYRQAHIVPLLEEEQPVPGSATKRSYMCQNVHSKVRHSKQV